MKIINLDTKIFTKKTIVILIFEKKGSNSNIVINLINHNLIILL